MKNKIVVYIFFLLIFSDFFQLEAMHVGYGRLVVDSIVSNVIYTRSCFTYPLFPVVGNDANSVVYDYGSLTFTEDKKIFFLNCLNNAYLPLMQLITGIVTTKLLSSQSLLALPINYMHYWGTYGLYKNAKEWPFFFEKIFKKIRVSDMDPFDQDQITKESDKDIFLSDINIILYNSLSFAVIAFLHYRAQLTCPALFKTVSPMGIGSIFLPYTWIGGGLDIVDQIVSFSQTKQLVLVTALILAVLKLKPKNNDYFYFKNIWLYITLDSMQSGLRYVQYCIDEEKTGLALPHETLKKEKYVEKVEARLFILNIFFKAVPVVVTVGHVLWNR